jgi:hypothetical protein
MKSPALFFAIAIALCGCSNATHDGASDPATSNFPVACDPWVDAACSCTPGTGPVTAGCPAAVYTCTDSGTWVYSGEVACHFGDAGFANDGATPDEGTPGLFGGE